MASLYDSSSKSLKRRFDKKIELVIYMTMDYISTNFL